MRDTVLQTGDNCLSQEHITLAVFVKTFRNLGSSMLFHF